MKRLFTLILLVAIACDEERTVAPTYSDITGNWTFTSGQFSGDFKISKGLDGKYVVETGTDFKVDQSQYVNSVPYTLKITGLSIMNVQLNDNGYYLIISDINYSSDFSSMTASQFAYGENTLSIVDQEIKISRK